MTSALDRSHKSSLPVIDWCLLLTGVLSVPDVRTPLQAMKCTACLFSECLFRLPRLVNRIREAADEYVQHEVRECDMAVERWRAECMKAHRQFKVTETARLVMEQRHQGQLQTMLRQQEEHLLQQQVHTFT